MRSIVKRIAILMPNDQLLEATYYLSDHLLNDEEKLSHLQLMIQLDDCHVSIKLTREASKNKVLIEKLIHNKVINTKGHLC